MASPQPPREEDRASLCVTLGSHVWLFPCAVSDSGRRRWAQHGRPQAMSLGPASTPDSGACLQHLVFPPCQDFGVLKCSDVRRAFFYTRDEIIFSLLSGSCQKTWQIKGQRSEGFVRAKQSLRGACGSQR